jgi:uncharacterized protein (DUF2141 family)
MSDIIKIANDKLTENYYSRQLNKLEAGEYAITIQLVDGNGVKTNFLSLNTESIPEVIKYLNELNEYLIINKR